MKKYIILSFLLVFTMSFTLVGCSNTQVFNAKTYSVAQNDVSSINIDVIDRNVEVVISEDNQIHIDYFESEKEFFNISVSDNEVLTMKFKNEKKWSDFVGKKPSAENRKITIKIPNALLNNLSIKTTNENIKIVSISVLKNITLDVNNGNIELEKVGVGDTINLIAKNGNISGSIIGSYDTFSIDCQIKKGESNLPTSKNDGEKFVKANCNNGNINIDFIQE